MTVKNVQRQISGGFITLTWESDLAYQFVYRDAALIVAATQEKTVELGYVKGAYYQVVDSATTTPVPDALDPQPPNVAAITWGAVADAVRYRVLLDGSQVATFNSPQVQYSYTTPRLSPGTYNLKVLSYDSAGNVNGTVTGWDFTVEPVPNPIQGLTITDGSVGGNVDLDILPPVGV